MSQKYKTFKNDLTKNLIIIFIEKGGRAFDKLTLFISNEICLAGT